MGVAGVSMSAEHRVLRAGTVAVCSGTEWWICVRIEDPLLTGRSAAETAATCSACDRMLLKYSRPVCVGLREILQIQHLA